MKWSRPVPLREEQNSLAWWPLCRHGHFSLEASLTQDPDPTDHESQSGVKNEDVGGIVRDVIHSKSDPSNVCESRHLESTPPENRVHRGVTDASVYYKPPSKRRGALLTENASDPTLLQEQIDERLNLSTQSPSTDNRTSETFPELGRWKAVRVHKERAPTFTRKYSHTSAVRRVAAARRSHDNADRDDQHDKEAPASITTRITGYRIVFTVPSSQHVSEEDMHIRKAVEAWCGDGDGSTSPSASSSSSAAATTTPSIEVASTSPRTSLECEAPRRLQICLTDEVDEAIRQWAWLEERVLPALNRWDPIEEPDAIYHFVFTRINAMAMVFETDVSAKSASTAAATTTSGGGGTPAISGSDSGENCATIGSGASPSKNSLNNSVGSTKGSFLRANKAVARLKHTKWMKMNKSTPAIYASPSSPPSSPPSLSPPLSSPSTSPPPSPSTSTSTSSRTSLSSLSDWDRDTIQRYRDSGSSTSTMSISPVIPPASCLSPSGLSPASSSATSTSLQKSCSAGSLIMDKRRRRHSSNAPYPALDGEDASVILLTGRNSLPPSSPSSPSTTPPLSPTPQAVTVTSPRSGAAATSKVAPRPTSDPSSSEWRVDLDPGLGLARRHCILWRDGFQSGLLRIGQAGLAFSYSPSTTATAEFGTGATGHHPSSTVRALLSPRSLPSDSPFHPRRETSPFPPTPPADSTPSLSTPLSATTLLTASSLSLSPSPSSCPISINIPYPELIAVVCDPIVKSALHIVSLNYRLLFVDLSQPDTIVSLIRNQWIPIITAMSMSINSTQLGGGTSNKITPVSPGRATGGGGGRRESMCGIQRTLSTGEAPPGFLSSIAVSLSADTDTGDDRNERHPLSIPLYPLLSEDDLRTSDSSALSQSSEEISPHSLLSSSADGAGRVLTSTIAATIGSDLADGAAGDGNRTAMSPDEEGMDAADLAWVRLQEGYRLEQDGRRDCQSDEEVAEGECASAKNEEGVNSRLSSPTSVPSPQTPPPSSKSLPDLASLGWVSPSKRYVNFSKMMSKTERALLQEQLLAQQKEERRQEHQLHQQQELELEIDQRPFWQRPPTKKPFYIKPPLFSMPLREKVSVSDACYLWRCTSPSDMHVAQGNFSASPSFLHFYGVSDVVPAWLSGLSSPVRPSSSLGALSGTAPATGEPSPRGMTLAATSTSTSTAIAADPTTSTPMAEGHTSTGKERGGGESLPSSCSSSPRKSSSSSLPPLTATGEFSVVVPLYDIVSCSVILLPLRHGLDCAAVVRVTTRTSEFHLSPCEESAHTVDGMRRAIQTLVAAFRRVSLSSSTPSPSSVRRSSSMSSLAPSVPVEDALERNEVGESDTDVDDDPIRSIDISVGAGDRADSGASSPPWVAGSSPALIATTVACTSPDTPITMAAPTQTSAVSPSLFPDGDGGDGGDGTDASGDTNETNGGIDSACSSGGRGEGDSAGTDRTPSGNGTNSHVDNGEDDDDDGDGGGDGDSGNGGGSDDDGDDDDGDDGDDHHRLESGLQIRTKDSKLGFFLEHLPPVGERLTLTERWKAYLLGHSSRLPRGLVPTDLGRTSALRRLIVRSGVPLPLRGQIWLMSCGAMYQHHRFSYVQGGASGSYPFILKNMASQGVAMSALIECDLKRSLPEHPYYSTQQGLDSLRRVLTAYSLRNPSIGYCQSMNILCAFFLLFMTEEEAFCMMCAICEDLLDHYHCPSMIGCSIDQKVLEHLVKTHLPDVSDHLTALEIPLSLITVPWLLCLFIGYVPYGVLLRVVDAFLCDGVIMLCQIALALLKMNRHDILETGDPGAALSLLKNLPNVDAHQLMKVATTDFGIRVLTRKEFHELRQHFHHVVVAELEDRNRMLAEAEAPLGGSGRSRRGETYYGEDERRKSYVEEVLRFEEYCKAHKRDLNNLFSSESGATAATLSALQGVHPPSSPLCGSHVTAGARAPRYPGADGGGDVGKSSRVALKKMAKMTKQKTKTGLDSFGIYLKNVSLTKREKK